MINLTRDSQEILLAHTLKNHPATAVLLSIVSDSDWGNEKFSEIWGVVHKHWLEYKTVPSRTVMMESVAGTTLPTLLKLYSVSDIESVASLVDRAIAFVKSRKLQDVIRTADNILETNPELAEVTLRKGLAGLPVPIYNSHSLQDLLPEAIYNYDDNRLGLATGISILDKAIRGGLGLGEVFIIAAPSGAGKSSLLSLMCCNVAMSVPCLYITLELTANRITRMLSSRIARIRQSEMSGDMSPELYVKLRKRVSSMYPIDVSYYPSETITVPQIGGMVEYMRQVKGINVQAVFLDYADHLTTNRVARNAPKWEKISSIYQELVDLGKVFNVAIFTASQLKNNEAIRSKVAEEVGQGDIAGSIEKMNKCDVAMAWKPLSTGSGIAKGIMSFMKVREGELPPAYMCTFDYDRLSLKFEHPFQAGADTPMIGAGNNTILNNLTRNTGQSE